MSPPILITRDFVKCTYSLNKHAHKMCAVCACLYLKKNRTSCQAILAISIQSQMPDPDSNYINPHFRPKTVHQHQPALYDEYATYSSTQDTPKPTINFREWIHLFTSCVTARAKLKHKSYYYLEPQAKKSPNSEEKLPGGGIRAQPVVGLLL